MSALVGRLNRSTQHSILKGGKMECMTIRRGYFRGFTCEKTETLGSPAACARVWDSNPSRENEIECCVDRLRPAPLADNSQIDVRKEKDRLAAVGARPIPR